MEEEHHLGFDIPETFLSPKIRRLFHIALSAEHDGELHRFFVEEEEKVEEHQKQQRSCDIPILSFAALNELFVSRGLLPSAPDDDTVDDLFVNSAAQSESRFEETLEVLAPVFVETATRWNRQDRNRDEWGDRLLDMLRSVESFVLTI